MTDIDHVMGKMPIGGQSDEQLANSLNLLYENMKDSIETAQRIANTDSESTIQDKVSIMMKLLVILNEQTYNNLESLEALIVQRAMEEDNGQE